MKKLLIIALAFVIAIAPAVFAKAAENQYYLVEGYVTPGGGGEITRIELVDDVAAVEVTPGTDYAISLSGEEGVIIANYPFGVSFETAPDLPFAQLDEARFAVLVPYDGATDEFNLVNRAGKVISSAYAFAWQQEIISFDVEETDTGFTLRWEVYYEAPSPLDFDVYAVSEITGEKNVLAYRTAERELTIPYDWLEPGDTVVFVLKSNDGSSTLTAESEAFNTPAGEAKDILDDEAWEGEWQYEAEDDLEWYWYLIIIFFLVLLPVGLIVLLVVFLKKRKKRKLSK